MSRNIGLSAYAVAFASLHLLANLKGWYLAYWWVDVVAHLGGGIWVAWTAWAYRGLIRGYAALPAWAQLLGVLAFVALVGVLWELLEALADAWLLRGAGVPWSAMHEAFAMPPYDLRWDTLWDLVNDLLGGAAALLVLRKR